MRTIEEVVAEIRSKANLIPNPYLQSELFDEILEIHLKLCAEEEQTRLHGEWIEVPKYKGFYVCSNCLERLDGDFERFDHWEMKKENFCPNCGSDNRKRGEKE